eukprot:s3663_g9.t1
MHFAISVLHVLNVLLMPSSAVTQAQPEPEAGCLLQRPGQQLVLKSDQAVPAAQIFQSLCSGSDGCTCSNPLSPTSQNGLDLTGCRSHCLPYPAFTLQLSEGGCTCCLSTATRAESGRAAYKFVRSLPGTLQEECETDQDCQCPPPATVYVFNLAGGVTGCSHFCYEQGFSTFAYLSSATTTFTICDCCQNGAHPVAETSENVVSKTYTINTISDLQSLCSGSDGCTCSRPISTTSQNGLDLTGCRSHCLPYPAFTLQLSEEKECICCQSTATRAESGRAAYKFVRSLPGTSVG